MLLQIARFEIRYWLRQPMVYIFLFVNALLVFGATSSDQITIGSSIGNVHKNAPYVIENFYAIFGILALLMVTAFLNSAAARDFSEKTYQLFFTKPIKKIDFLGGRYLGACLVAMLPFLGISIGNIIGVQMGWLEPERVGPTIWSGHLYGFLVFTVTNTLLTGAIIFSIAALTRSTIISFVGSILLLIGYTISQSLLGDLDNEMIAAMLDPFGIRAFGIMTKYWTVNDRNTLALGFEGILLLNRLLWAAISLVIVGFTYMKFHYGEKTSGKKKKIEIQKEVKSLTFSFQPLPKAIPEFSSTLTFRQFISQVKIETLSILKNTTFIIITIAGVLNMIAAMTNATNAGYGNHTFPVTYSVLEIIQGSLYTFLVAIITFYTGVMIWRERDVKMSDITDSLPGSEWIGFVSKAIAMTIVIEVLLLLACLTGMSTQLLYGFDVLKPDVYFTSMLILNGIDFFFLIVLAMFIHTMVNNKYIGYFVFIAFIIANNFIWSAMNIDSNMLSFGGTPSITYSDMNGYGPFMKGVCWFNLYWFLFCGLLVITGILFWVRGRNTGFKTRLAIAKTRFHGPIKYLGITIVMLWVITGSWVYYNTQVINSYPGPEDRKTRAADYEKKYKKYNGITQPRITDVKYSIELYPKQRCLEVESVQWMKNISSENIDSVHFTMPTLFDIKIDIPGAKLVLNDSILNYRIYRLSKPMMPGDSLQFIVNSKYAAKGFENNVSYTSVVENGSFFNNFDMIPSIGYQSSNEMESRNERKKKGLAPKDRMPKLEANCNQHCMNSYISNNSDWVNVETVIGTSGDQIAIAPGSLIKEWKKDGRNYFHYKLDHKAINFYSFMSAAYSVKREKWNNIDLEVYYIPEHKWNIDRMMKSMKSSLDYYTNNFGPYYQKQARIVEFPRYASFAQAFPGTMPYSESIGFIDYLENPDDIDMVYYVVAHEMGHQWWAHQVCGAEMQGATFLSESMAQYSALMVMEKHYGRDQMRKFLKYEMDRYLRSRGGEQLKEVPLLLVENQGYIHYNKASVLMYNFREMVGENAVNSALKNLIDSFAYRQPPYPTSYELAHRFEAVTPDSIKYVTNDLFYEMTLYNNRVVEASAKKLPDNSYEVTFTVSCEKFRADSLGQETKIPLNDRIEVALLAKPEEGKEYGKKLWSSNLRMTQQKQQFTARVKELPYNAGVDPDYLMIDRVPDDNLKKIEFD
jgi:ABC-2 type transport system permease protein